MTKNTRKVKFSISELKKTYPDSSYRNKGNSAKRKKALEIDSLDLYEGKFIAIMGVSGSGKSTLLNMLGRIDYPDTEDENTIIFRNLEGEQIPYSGINKFFNSDHGFRKKHFGYVFQRCYELKYFRTDDNIAMPLAVRGENTRQRRESAKNLGIRLGLTKKELYDPAGKLSGGQISRLSILRGIAHDPNVVFADEPTSSLDPKTGRMVMKLLESWKNHKGNKNNNRTVVIVTHNLDHSFRYADQIVVLKNGEQVFNEVRPGEKDDKNEISGWEEYEKTIAELMSIKEPPEKKLEDQDLKSVNSFAEWYNRQLFAVQFAVKDLFPNLTIKGLSPMFLGVLSIWFLLLIGYFFTDLKQIGKLNNQLLLQNPFLMKIEVSEMGDMGFTRRLIDRISSISKSDLRAFFDSEIQKRQQSLNIADKLAEGFNSQVTLEEIDELMLFDELLEDSEEYENVASVFPYSYTSAHFKMKNGVDAPSRPDGRTLKSWDDPMLSKLVYLTHKPLFKTYNEHGLIVSEGLVRKLGYKSSKVTHLTYKYSKIKDIVDIPVLAVVKGLPEGTDYLLTANLQEKLLGQCYQNVTKFQSVRIGPLESKNIPGDWIEIAKQEGMDVSLESINSLHGEKQWVRWKTLNPAKSLALENWSYFLSTLMTQSMSMVKVEEYIPPCEDIKLYYAWAAVYAKEQGFVPALESYMQLNMPDYRLTVLRSERDAILMANRSANFIDNLFMIIMTAVVVLGLIAIFSTFSSSIERKSAEIAVVQAIGAGSRKIAQIFSIETFIVFAIAAILGLICDIFIVDWIVDHPDFKKILFPKNTEPLIIVAALDNLSFLYGRLTIFVSGAVLSVVTAILTVYLFLRRPIAEAVREN